RCVAGSRLDGGAPPNDAPPPAGAKDLAAASDLAAAPACGDGVIDIGEQCDDGAANSDAPSAAAKCTTQCRARASCGALAGSTAQAIDPASGHCYVAWPGPLSWQAAARACESNGGALASITSSAEDTLVRGLASAPSWIGASSPLDKAQFTTWVSGEPIAYTGFAPGQPSNGAKKECLAIAAAGWQNDACGWPTSGNLQASAAHAAPYVCESACGNGAVDPGEECDPPGAACTASCKKIRACTEPGAVSSTVNGHCYFLAGTAAAYATAKLACPAGTHVATLNAPEETDAAITASTAQAWIALTGTPGNFAWESGEDFNSRRYHGFIAGEPNTANAPVCVRVVPGGWADQPCSSTFVTLCERE